MSRTRLTQIIVACAVLSIIAMVLFVVRPWERPPSSDVHTLSTIVSPSGAGSISPPGGEYDSGFQVTLTASPANGYVFDHWTGGVSGSSNPVTITMTSDKSITAHFVPQIWEIRDWHDLDAIRKDLDGNYTLLNDLDSATPGYAELAGGSANDGKGWQPIGASDAPFTGSFNGQGHEIRDLVINRPDEDYVGLFAHVAWAHPVKNVGAIENVGMVNARVTGHGRVGALAGQSAGIVTNSYSTGSVTGRAWFAGGLVGYDEGGLVSDSYSTGSVTGTYYVGGLVGRMTGTRTVREGVVSRCYSTTYVAGATRIGGLVGATHGDVNVSDCYFDGSVSGRRWLGGLVAENYGGNVSNCYSAGRVTGGEFVGGLLASNLWGTITNCYSSGAVSGESPVGGLVGKDDHGTVGNSFWNISTSGQKTSDGGTGKATAEMMSLATFADTVTEGVGEPWDIVAVTPGQSDAAYTWNIVDRKGYPFLSWQTVG